MLELKETTYEHVQHLLSNIIKKQDANGHDICFCPFCGEKKGHLYVNRETGKWLCFICGRKGNALTLYAHMLGMSYSEAYREIHCKEQVFPKNRLQKSAAVLNFPQRQKTAVKEADITVRDKVYRSFLEHLPLYLKHAENLAARGFTKQEAVENLYRSLPKDPQVRQAIAAELAQKYNLRGIKGFKQADGVWTHFYISGFVIPFRDEHNRVQALQVRSDLDRPKYLHFSFSDVAIDAETSIHVANPDAVAATKTLWVTEGPLKADYCAPRLNACFLAVPGVSCWRAALKTIDRLGVREVVQAFDADQKENPAVAHAVSQFEAAVQEKGINVVRAVWDAAFGNGIDDAVKNSASIKITASHPARQVTTFFDKI